MSGGNDRDGIDQSTSFWLDKGGGDGDPTTQAWSDERERVSADPDRDDWRQRDGEDLEQATVAAVDEVRSRDSDRSDWDAGREHRDWVRERWPTTKLGNYIADKLKWHSAFQTNPMAAEEAWTRMWLRQPPFHHKQAAKTKAEMPPDLARDGVVEWERLQAVKDALASANGDRADADDFEATADLRALVKERTGLTLSQFLEKARDIDTASLENPAAVAYRFSTFSGAPVNEQHATEMVNTAQHTQLVAGAKTWLGSLEQQGRLPEDYRDLEPEIANALTAMNQNGLRTGDYEADLDTAIRVARNVVNDRQQQTGTTDPQAQQWVLTAYNSLLTKGFGSDYAMQKARELVAAAYQQQRDEAHAEKARRASRSVTGSPSTGAGPSTRRREGTSYEDDLLADVTNAVRYG